MTTAIMTRPAARTTAAVNNPYTVGTGQAAALKRLEDLVQQLVVEADARAANGRRARRTLQEMMPGYERQPVLTLRRPVMADDSCPLCGNWNCDPSKCPPSGATVPAPAVPRNNMQCDMCGGVFGAAPLPTGTQSTRLAPTAWTCDACQALGL